MMRMRSKVNTLQTRCLMWKRPDICSGPRGCEYALGVGRGVCGWRWVGYFLMEWEIRWVGVGGELSCGWRNFRQGVQAYYMRRREWGCLGGTRAVCFGTLQTRKNNVGVCLWEKLVPDSWEANKELAGWDVRQGPPLCGMQ